jgi:FkbM family methyltransferase
LSGRARNWAGATLKRAGQRAGLEIRRYRPGARRRAELLAQQGIELVIDVGANRGQYGAELREHGYRGRIVSFEPSSEAFETLLRRSAADELWSARQLAASDQNGVVELGAADNFSSLLPVEERLATLFPEAVRRRRERVAACRLDAAGIELPAPGATLLKLDVQGYESRALAGAAGIRESIVMIESELSVVALYRGQPLLDEMICRLREDGYQMVGLDPTLRDRRTGEYLQFDGLFVKR